MKRSIGQSDVIDGGSKSLLARYPLVFYFIVAYAFAWLAEMPLVLSEDGAGLLSYAVRWDCTLPHARYLCGPMFVGLPHDEYNPRALRDRPLTSPVGSAAG